MDNDNLPKTVESKNTVKTKKTDLIFRKLKTVNWWWVAKIFLRGTLIAGTGSPIKAFKLICKVALEIESGKCFEKKSLADEMKSISSLGFRVYCQQNWEEIKEFLLSVVS